MQAVVKSPGTARDKEVIQTARILLPLMSLSGFCLQAGKEGKFGRMVKRGSNVQGKLKCRIRFYDSAHRAPQGGHGGWRQQCVHCAAQRSTRASSPWAPWLLSEWVTGLNKKMGFGCQSCPSWLFTISTQSAAQYLPLCNQWRPSSQGTQGSHF